MENKKKIRKLVVGIILLILGFAGFMGVISYFQTGESVGYYLGAFTVLVAFVGGGVVLIYQYAKGK